MKKHLNIHTTLQYHSKRIKIEFKYLKFILIIWAISLFLIWNTLLFKFPKSITIFIKSFFIISSLYIIYFFIKYIFICLKYYIVIKRIDKK